ncbi:GntR family transcriptional regulator [Paenibacillus eucommiae]|uniref:GntR family transcriptional regulator n=1 Tax=Paenibacillus eucommiae TaxID=1355755 RepID=A0ABS4IX21_9BACL|nr:GntR family transcriptional regulator [Paenibacillus eucommiae]MBP1992138.1 GntR family transcriptional regulator [Paenibacillus eucommiae]
MKNIIDKFGPEPLYVQVQNWIQTKIANGDWKPKEKLPAEADLAVSLSISRGTVKQALKNLVDEGILVQIHGKGTFVVGKQIESSLAERLVSIAETMYENERDFTTSVLDVQLVEANAQIKVSLKLEPDEKIYAIQRLRFLEGTPVVFLENYLSARKFPNLDRFDFSKNTLFSIIENDYKVVIDWGKRSFVAKSADDRTADMLQIEKGTPVIFLEQVIYSEADMPIECSRIWIRSDQIKLTSILKRH